MKKSVKQTFRMTEPQSEWLKKWCDENDISFQKWAEQSLMSMGMPDSDYDPSDELKNQPTLFDLAE